MYKRFILVVVAILTLWTPLVSACSRRCVPCQKKIVTVAPIVEEKPVVAPPVAAQPVVEVPVVAPTVIVPVVTETKQNDTSVDTTDYTNTNWGK